MRLHVALGLLVATFVDSYVSFASADPSLVDGRFIESTEVRLLREAEPIVEDRAPTDIAETVSHAVAMSKADGGLLASTSKIHAVDEGVAGVAVKMNEQIASAAAKSDKQVADGVAKSKDEVAGGVAKSKDEVAGGVAKSKDEVADAPPKTKEELEAEAKVAEAAKTKKEVEGRPSPLKVALASVVVIALLGAVTGWALHMAHKHEVATPQSPVSGSGLGSMSG